MLFAQGCDLIGSDESRTHERDSVLLTFRVEADTPPNEGWIFWYVREDILYREGAGVSHGPFGATADCGSHAGIAARIVDAPEAPDRGALVIETVEENPAEAMVAREEFSGPGEHQLVVLVTCP